MYAVETNAQAVDGNHCVCNFPQSEEMFDSLGHSS